MISLKYFKFSTLTILALACGLCITSCKKNEKINATAIKMKNFVVDIAQYARIQNPQFIVVPQNGVELAFNGLEINTGTDPSYINAINGLGIEALFYNKSLQKEDERINMLRILKNSKTILSSELIKNDEDLINAYTKNNNEGFTCFVRQDINYHYTQIPSFIYNENSQTIYTLSDAKNYLYIINPENFTSKSDYLQALSETNYDLLLIDLFYNGEALNATEINSLKIKANGGSRLVLCYLNIGSAENYRYYWNENWNQKKPSWIKKRYAGYSDEFWVEFWHEDWQNIIYKNANSYLQKIINSSFDGVYLDNIEAYYFLYHNQ